VWLLDTSLHGIYAPDATRVASDLTCTLHELWWKHHGAWLFEQTEGTYRCVIGSGTAQRLARIGVPWDNWICQPQAGSERVCRADGTRLAGFVAPAGRRLNRAVDAGCCAKDMTDSQLVLVANALPTFGARGTGEWCVGVTVVNDDSVVVTLTGALREHFGVRAKFELWVVAIDAADRTFRANSTLAA
jgi:hypothetical protein